MPEPTVGRASDESAVPRQSTVEELEARVAVLEDLARVLLTQNHLGERLPYPAYRHWWGQLHPHSDIAELQAQGRRIGEVLHEKYPDTVPAPKTVDERAADAAARARSRRA